MHINEIIALAGKHIGTGAAMDSSARLCLADAVALRNANKFDDAKRRAIKSLGYSVGLFHADYQAANAPDAYTIGADSTDVTKFIYSPCGELVATLRAPDDNRAGVEFVREHAERIVAALNAPAPTAV